MHNPLSWSPLVVLYFANLYMLDHLETEPTWLKCVAIRRETQSLHLLSFSALVSPWMYQEVFTYIPSLLNLEQYEPWFCYTRTRPSKDESRDMCCAGW